MPARSRSALQGRCSAWVGGRTEQVPRKRRRRMVGKKFEDAQQREAEREVEHLERKLHRDWKRPMRRPDKTNDDEPQTKDG